MLWLDALLEKAIRWRAENAMMRKCGVSRAYIREVVANIDQWQSGAITTEQWSARAVSIADRYPQDTARAGLVGEGGEE